MTLGSDQELKTVDDQNAVVSSEDGHVAFTITAAKAHDADGAAVPTTPSISGENTITLTVHHRAGNPAAGGAPFNYPITQGEGWEGGSQTHVIEMPPPVTLPISTLAPCTVPRLIGGSLKVNRKALARAGCKLGKVRGDRSRGAKVTKQDVRAGTLLPAGSSISVKVS